jgi:hypothetical protein
MLERDPEVTRLADLIFAELAAVPIESWVEWAPVRVAMWRFIHEARPEILGDVQATIEDGSVAFHGPGADWFGRLEARADYIDLIDNLMRAAVDAVPRSAQDRGFVRQGELPSIDREVVAGLVAIVSDQFDSLTSVSPWPPRPRPSGGPGRA